MSRHTRANYHEVLLALVLGVFLFSESTHSFVPSCTINPNILRATSQTSTSINIFGGLKDAFSNEDNLPKQNAGLTNGPRNNDQVTVNGKKSQSCS